MFGFGKKVEEPIEEPQVTSDVPVAEAKAEGQKLEWGVEIGKVDWSSAREKISELNTGLSEGQKPWRLPTAEEILSAIDNGVPFKTFEQGFNYYWTSEDTDDSSFAFVVETDSRKKVGYGKAQPNNNVRPVRDTA